MSAGGQSTTAHPHRTVHQPQGLALGRHRQGRMQQQTNGFGRVRTQKSQSGSLGMSRVIKRRGVLDGQHHRMLLDPLQRSLVVGSADVARNHSLVLQKPISPFSFGPIRTGFGNWRTGLLRKGARHQLQTTLKTFIGQCGLRKLMDHPVRCLGRRSLQSGQLLRRLFPSHCRICGCHSFRVRNRCDQPVFTPINCSLKRMRQPQKMWVMISPREREARPPLF